MLNPFAVCAARQSEMRVAYESDVIRRANERWAGLYKNLTIWTGQKSFDFVDGDMLYDELLFLDRALINDPQKPEWLTKQLLTELKEMRKTSFEVLGVTPRIQRLTMGLFLNELKEKISRAIRPTSVLPHYEDTDETGVVKKLNVYSTHDIFLFNLIQNLGFIMDELPPFGAAIIFELFVDRLARSNFEQSSSIRIWYLNETLTDYLHFKANPLRLPGYDRDRYTVEEFLDSFAHLLMTETEAEIGCRFNNTGDPTISSNSSSTYIVVIVIESIVILLFVGLSVKRCMSK